jgi:ribose/xylose/arabinose/galactoside ABC-type transport system permease subunit
MLTTVFLTCIGLYLARVRSSVGWSSRAAWSLHAVMALAMIAMAWPWGMRFPVIFSVLVFTASALYFAYLGLFLGAVGHTPYHAAMMASMVVMSVAMSSARPISSGGQAPRAMPGVDMARRVSVSAATPAWVVFGCGAAAVAFFLATLTSFYALVRGPRRRWADVLMSAGMGVAFAALAV